MSTIDDALLCPSNTMATIEPPDLTTPSNNETTKDPPVTMVTTEPPDLSDSDHTQSTTPTNCSTDGCGHTQITVIYFAAHHGFLVAIFVISLFLFLVLLTIWLCCWRRNSSLTRSRKRTIGKYKPVNQFFPCKNGVMGIAIPEMGLPKTMSSEREKLIIESDEDEL